MDSIVEAILKLEPFGNIFKKLGLSDNLSALFSILLVLAILTFFGWYCKKMYKRYHFQQKALEDINPQFDHLSIKKAKQFYIQTQYQNASPARQEEPGFTHKYIARNKLIPFFLKTAFNEKVDSERFFLILADSGMGKTTFMVNLYLHYNSFFNFSRKHKMKLYRFSNSDTINQIKCIKKEEARRTILLLDALDEDLGIVSRNPSITDAQAFQSRIDKIIEITKNFREIVITCRTQYFPGQEEDPYELKVKRPDEKGFYTLNKLYISPFNDKEVKLYLNKKFGIIPFINYKSKTRALKIVSQSRNLIMRPMLLGYIDYLIEDEMSNVTTSSVYEILVSKWLQREAEKRKGLADKGAFIENLRKLSIKTAIVVYNNWRTEGRMFLSKEEALGIAHQFDILLKAEEITGQSLLTCDGAGNWKFAHKSILEYFLAKEAFQNPKSLKTMDFKGMDMAKRFYGELNPFLMFIDGSTKLRDSLSQKCKTLKSFYIYADSLVKMGPQTIKTYGSPDSIDAAMALCNQVNKDYGYAPVYDKEYNLIDANGSIVKEISQVRGFRLPTVCELQIFMLSAETKVYKAGAGFPKLFFESTKTTILSSLEISTSDYKKTKGTRYEEWCYDESGISVVGFSYVMTHASPVDFRSNLADGVKTLTIVQAKSRKCPFRMVLIP